MPGRPLPSCSLHRHLAHTRLTDIYSGKMCIYIHSPPPSLSLSFESLFKNVNWRMRKWSIPIIPLLRRSRKEYHFKASLGCMRLQSLKMNMDGARGKYLICPQISRIHIRFHPDVRHFITKASDIPQFLQSAERCFEGHGKSSFFQGCQ